MISLASARTHAAQARMLIRPAPAPPQGLLVLAVAAGVGLSAALGILRIRRGWSLKPPALAATAAALLLSAYVHWFTDRRDLLGLAWDLGAVATGPVTVPRLCPPALLPRPIRPALPAARPIGASRPSGRGG